MVLGTQFTDGESNEGIQREGEEGEGAGITGVMIFYDFY